MLDGGLLYEGAKAGDTVKAEAEFELEGIVITSVTAPKREDRPQAQRIEVVGPSRPDTPPVTTQLVGRAERRDRPRDGDDSRRRDRGPGRTGDGRPRGDLGRPRRDGAPSGDSTDGRPRRDAGPRREAGPRRDAGPGGDSGPPDSRSREGRAREGAASRPGPDSDRRGAGRTSSQAEHLDRSKARRLNPGSTHRRAVMDSLPPEHQPIAEHLLRGGIPAVRTALHLEREKAEADGRAAPNSEALLALAESLLPRLRAAEWRDRAEAAAAAVADISMRDLRSVVAGSDLARDDESRALAATLREAIESRVAKLHATWTADITTQLDAGRVVRAVRLSARPPDAGARLEAELADRLTAAAGATLSPETPPELWASLLEAVAESPIRRAVVPTGLPDNAPPDLKRAAHQYSGNIPALAKLLGVAIPPPPAPIPGRRRSQDRPAGSRPAGSRPGRRSETGRPNGTEARSEQTEASPPAPAGQGTSSEPAGAPDVPPARGIVGAAAEAGPADVTTAEAAPATDAAADAAHADEGSHAAPASDAPATDAPAGDAPASDAPASDAPASDAANTEADS